MTFWKTVGAYLTGWVIAQSIFMRALRRAQRTQTEEFKHEVAAFVASHLADELELRSKELSALREVNLAARKFASEKLAYEEQIGQKQDERLLHLADLSDRASVVRMMRGDRVG